MKKIAFFILTLLLLRALNLPAQESIKLKFNEDGRFRIAQFTDLHWIDGSPNCNKTASTMKYVLETEKPDLAILTGDIAWQVPSRRPWRDIPKIFEDAKVPFAVVLGNHDAEGGTEITRDEIFDILSQSPYFVGEKGPDNIYGSGNYVLPVLGKKSTIATLLYCFDSNAYVQNTLYGFYDWVHFDQVEWYRHQSQKYTEQNNGIPLPALAFLHIPLPEYKEILDKPSTIGHHGEDIASPRVNSGLFGAFVDMRDVKGVFAGHEHDNDFIGLNFDIALAYGRSAGSDAYGSLTHGARIIEMKEDSFKYSTWISTPKGKELFFYYPSGISSVDEETMNYLPDKQVSPKKRGVSYTYYEGKFKSFNDTTTAVKVSSGTMENLSVKNASAKNGFAYDFHSFVHIPKKGIYRFYTISDDHSRLFIDGNLVVDNDNSIGFHAFGKLALEAGFHALRVLYFQDAWGRRLDVGFCDKNTTDQLIPCSMLFIPE